DAVRALEWIGVKSRADVRATLAGLLVHRHEDLARFDEAFDLFFRAHGSPAPGPPLFSLGERPRVVVKPVAGAPPEVKLEDAAPATSAATLAVGAYSAAAVSRTKDFAEFTPAELEEARRLLARLPWTLGVRRTRRWAAAPDGAVDLRPFLRRNLMRGGAMIDLPRRRRRD